jgi:hypothetical protein
MGPRSIDSRIHVAFAVCMTQCAGNAAFLR